MTRIERLVQGLLEADEPFNPREYLLSVGVQPENFGFERFSGVPGTEAPESWMYKYGTPPDDYSLVLTRHASTKDTYSISVYVRRNAFRVCRRILPQGFVEDNLEFIVKVFEQSVQDWSGTPEAVGRAMTWNLQNRPHG